MAKLVQQKLSRKAQARIEVDVNKLSAKDLEWIENNKDSLGPAEIAPQHALRIDAHAGLLDVLQTDTPVPKARRRNKGGKPKDYDEELGVIHPWADPKRKLEPEPEPTLDERKLWTRLATDLVGRLGATSNYREAMPVARLPEMPPARVSTATLRALPELEALHRKLCQPWLAVLENWFDQCARRRLELYYRDVWKHGKKRKSDPLRVNVVDPLPDLTSAEELVHSFERNFGEAPPLNPAVLKALSKIVTRGGGRQGGGLTPASAVEVAINVSAEVNWEKALQAEIRKRNKRRSPRSRQRAKTNL
jgi:hypothetical protein